MSTSLIVNLTLYCYILLAIIATIFLTILMDFLTYSFFNFSFLFWIEKKIFKHDR